MKNPSEYSVSKRTVRAFIIMAIILIPIGFGMAFADMQLTRSRESAQNELKMNVLARLVANESDMLDAAKEQFDRNLSATVEMMTTSLRAFVTEDGYTGPRVLSDGFVAELRGDDVVLPDGVSEGRMIINRRGRRYAACCTASSSTFRCPWCCTSSSITWASPSVRWWAR